MLLNKEYDAAVDWWQLGIMTYQMLTRTSPFKGDDQDEVYDAMLSEDPSFPDYMTRDSISFIQRLMEKEPGKRLGSGMNGADQGMAHVFFNGVNWDDVYHKRVEPPFELGSRGPMDIGQDRP